MSISSRHSLCSLAAAHVTCFERFERRTLVCLGGSDPNRLSHPLRERSAPRGSERAKNKLRKNFFRPIIRCNFAGAAMRYRTLLGNSRSKLSRLAPATSSPLDVRGEIALLPRPSERISGKNERPADMAGRRQALPFRENLE